LKAGLLMQISVLAPKRVGGSGSPDSQTCDRINGALGSLCGHIRVTQDSSAPEHGSELLGHILGLRDRQPHWHERPMGGQGGCIVDSLRPLRNAKDNAGGEAKVILHIGTGIRKFCAQPIALEDADGKVPRQTDINSAAYLQREGVVVGLHSRG
jgi:hypothetical protein